MPATRRAQVSRTLAGLPVVAVDSSIPPGHHDAFSASSAVAELLALVSADGVPSDLAGAGEVPVREMLGLLQAAGYPHWISVEWEKRWHPEIEEPEVALPQHLDLLTRWLGSA